MMPQECPKMKSQKLIKRNIKETYITKCHYTKDVTDRKLQNKSTMSLIFLQTSQSCTNVQEPFNVTARGAFQTTPLKHITPVR